MYFFNTSSLYLYLYDTFIAVNNLQYSTINLIFFKSILFQYFIISSTKKINI